MHDVKDGARLSMGGFGLVGIPENGVFALMDMGVKNLDIVSNLAGIYIIYIYIYIGTADWGIGLMLQKDQIARMNASYVGENAVYEKLYLGGKVVMNLIPQGTLAEKIRSGSAGVHAYFTPTGQGTLVELGGFPIKLKEDGKSMDLVSKPKERRHFNGREYLLEECIKVDFAMIKAFQADHKGNLRFRKTARNFNPDMCGHGTVNVAEVEEIVDELAPEDVHYSGCFIDRVFKGEKFHKKIERLRVDTGKGIEMPFSKERGAKRLRIVQRAMQELKDGMYCNLGIGIPTLTSNLVMGKVDVELQSENGIVGMGAYPKEHEVDADLINAGKETVTAKPGACFARSSETFGMMRGGHLHMTMLGGLEASETADLANWIIPGAMIKGMGGAMDLVSSGARVVVVMEHTSKHGESKVLKECSLPLTGKGCVTRLITDMVYI